MLSPILCKYMYVEIPCQRADWSPLLFIQLGSGHLAKMTMRGKSHSITINDFLVFHFLRLLHLFSKTKVTDRLQTLKWQMAELKPSNLSLFRIWQGLCWYLIPKSQSHCMISQKDFLFRSLFDWHKWFQSFWDTTSKNTSAMVWMFMSLQNWHMKS